MIDTKRAKSKWRKRDKESRKDQREAKRKRIKLRWRHREKKRKEG